MFNSPFGGPLDDHSAAITAGATAQTVIDKDLGRKYFLFQNHSDTDMWIDFGAVAVADRPSIKIIAGATYENPSHFCPTDYVSVICATTGKEFTCKSR